MAQTIKLKRSADPGNEPTLGQLALGELAINTYDGLLFIRKDDGTASIVRVNDRDTDDLSEGNTNLYFTAQRVRDEIDGNPLDDIDYIDLSTSSSPSHAEGRIFYDNVNKALAVYNSEADITLQVGQEEYLRVYNSTGSTLTNGTPVYATGSFEGTPTVAAADATTETKARVEGVVTHSIENNSYGFVTVRGMVSDIDTSGLTAGYPIHVAADGSLQTAAPTYPYYATDIGGCITSHASTGKIYVRIQHHSFETIRVSGNSHFDGNLTVDGDFTVNGSQSVVSQNNLSVDNSFVYLNSGDTIGEDNTSFNGTGLDDAYFTGHYEGTTSSKSYYVRIDGVGTGTGGVDTFEWSLDDFSTTEATGVDITGTRQNLEDGVEIFFNATTGHTSGDSWSGTASPVNTDSGWFSNRNTGASGVGYTHMGIFFDASDEKFKVVSEYDPEPEGTIDTSDASYTTGTLVGDFEGSFNLTGSITGIGSVNIDGDITTSGEVTASQINFEDDTSLSWNSSDRTLNLEQDGVTLQVGQENHFVIRNATGSTLPNGTFVGFVGVTVGSNRIKAGPFDASAMVPHQMIGFCTESISNGINGIVTTFGYVRDLDTRGTAASSMAVGDEDWSVGDILYPHPTVAGKLTNVAPTTGFKSSVAVITNRHQTAGEIFVRVTPSDERSEALAYTAMQPGDDMSELNNDMWEVTSTVPTDGTGKPAGYVWYIV
jgi:hypothetical protein